MFFATAAGYECLSMFKGLGSKFVWPQ